MVVGGYGWWGLRVVSGGGGWVLRVVVKGGGGAGIGGDPHIHYESEEGPTL